MAERMTEADWFDDDRANPQWMLWQLTPPLGKMTSTKSGRRKLRLFACACCRLLDETRLTPALGDAVAVAERYADGRATTKQLEAAHNSIARTEFQEGTDDASKRAYWAPRLAQVATGKKAADVPLYMTDHCLRNAGLRGSAKRVNATLCGLVRCVIGNPFAPLPARDFPVNVVFIAQSCDASFPEVSGDFRHLAKVLEGLGEGAAAAHCREKLHAKGCHVLDWILGKS